MTASSLTAADLDGCGAFMVASTSNTFDPGCGPVVPPVCENPSDWPADGCALPGDLYIGVARYAP